MKRILITLLAGMVLMCEFTVQAYAAAATTLATTSIECIGANCNEIQYTYAAIPSVTVGADTVFKIAVPSVAGKITDIAISTASPDYDYWLSESDEETEASYQTRIDVQECDETSPCSPALLPARSYVNRDTTQAAYLYLTISNKSATVTGAAGVAVITFAVR